MTTVAGNGANGFGADGAAATAAPVNNPTGLAVEPTGALLIAESSHARIRRVNLDGTLSAVAGTGVPGFSGDGGPATSATISHPTQVTVDDAGNVDFSDSDNFRVRQILRGSPHVDHHGCGEVIVRSTTLTGDVGPCAGSDGIVIGADNITVNLGGHHILGPGAGNGDGAHTGIRIANHTGVTVTGGTVTGFDAGVAVIGGSANTVSKLTVERNVAPLITAAGFEQSEFGDGIVLMFSNHNHVTGNHLDANGPFDGIGALGLGSNFNTIDANTVANTVGDGQQNSPGIGEGILIDPFLDFTLPGRGGSLEGNNIVGNTITGSYTDGISSVSNINATIAHNTATGNGLHNPFPGNGIGVTRNARAVAVTNDVVDSNISHGNAGNGLDVGGNSNHITNNDAANNVLGPNPFHLRFDLRDSTRDPITRAFDCTDNVWSGNIWGSGGYSNICVTAGGHLATAATVTSAGAAALDPTSTPTAPDQDPPHALRQLAPADRALGSG